jgi:HAD superfamily hydrolase (TIGR01509 family)
MIKSIIFDLGGVLIPETGASIERIVANKLNIPVTKFNEISTDLKSRCTIGEITLLEFYNKVISKTGSKINPRELFNLHLSEFEKLGTRRDSNILGLFERIKQDGYNLACLTNTEIEVAEFNKRNGLFDYFGEYAFLSTELKMRKPQKEIYIEVAKRMKRENDECIFIDDKPGYVKPAIDIGMNGIVYQNAEQLVKELKKFIRHF